MTSRYPTPDFLADKLEAGVYIRWLRRKAAAHLKRDRARGNRQASGKSYRTAIHDAVIASRGLDDYTGETLDWSLISTYDGEKSKAGRSVYKATFGLLPSVDHVGNGLCAGNFKICAWRTNDAKSDLTLDDFVKLCRRVAAYSDLKHQVGRQTA